MYSELVMANAERETLVKVKKATYSVIKRLFDIFFAIIGIIFLIPAYLFVKISYMLSGDFNSVFYRQNRIGKDGKVIRIFKFRSMVKAADIILKDLIKKEPYKTEWENNQKLSNDPRITKVGKIIRKTSIDELPQFINVLLGDMSLIGPRPLVKGELDSHNGNHKIYESVKPGITGWWACNGRSATTYEERLKLEYYYVKHMSFKLDILCIFKTIQAILFKDEAK